MTKEASEAIGESETAAMLEKRIEEKKQAILNAYYSPQTGSFIGDAQGANSFAIDIGLGGERAFNNTKRNTTPQMLLTPAFSVQISSPAYCLSAAAPTRLSAC